MNNPLNPRCRCGFTAAWCECGVYGRPGWPGGTRMIPREELAAKARQKEEEQQAASDSFTFEGFENS